MHISLQNINATWEIWLFAVDTELTDFLHVDVTNIENTCYYLEGMTLIKNKTKKAIFNTAEVTVLKK